MLRGKPHLEIIRYAKENTVDLIVMASHGLSGLEHVLFGSTAERVLRESPCNGVGHQDVSRIIDGGGRRSIIFLTSPLFGVNKCLNKSPSREESSSRQQKTTALAVEEFSIS